MSSIPSFGGLSSWGRRRSSSLHSQEPDNQDNQEDGPSEIPANVRSTQNSQSHSDGKFLSSSVNSSTTGQGHREPIRSFIHGTVRDDLARVDSVQSARSVREDTAELANYFLSSGDNKKDGQKSSAFLARARSRSYSTPKPHISGQDHYGATPIGDEGEEVVGGASVSAETIAEVSEPSSPEDRLPEAQAPEEGPSIIATMLRRSPPDERYLGALNQKADQADEQNTGFDTEEESDDEVVRRVPSSTERASQMNKDGADEAAPLLSTTRSRESRRSYGMTSGSNGVGRAAMFDPESQQKRPEGNRWLTSITDFLRHKGAQISGAFRVVCEPNRWDRRAIWQHVFVAPVACLPAVIVGLLLNILDALSYGMILFPLGNPIFANLGSAGISMFYVSTIISQLIFSFGSIFKGAVGSELIEVVPFFHSMAAKITDIVGEDNPDAVIATTITSYALSSMLTGAVFYLMGKFKFGHIVGFIPRHILIGCIGGVGFFLVVTGFEVTARMDGSLHYDLDTLRRLGQADTIPLWTIPLGLAIILFYGQTRITSKFFLPFYILAIPAIFYFFVLSLDVLDLDTLRDKGWIFEGPPAGEPWWYFYTLYQFDKVHWGAILQCVPAMFALTFFGILHVPINVPALALNTGEDHADLDHELILHGYSNILSGAAGSIQNYLVYANSLFFMRSGGDSRMAGVELAILTGGVMMIGPSLVGFIPVMMVGVLIFDLGFELLLEAVWQPRKKLKRLEYLTVIAIVLIMGIYDFVVGIGVGILLAFISLIFQTSRVSAVRASYSGDIVGSTVRRNPTQQHYLKQVGRQISVIKLAGYLFFGTIVSVEDKIRALIADEAFKERPIQFLILDLWQVTGLDYSAGEAFNTISRLLHSKGIELVISGVDPDRELGRSLRAVGLGETDGIEVKLLPELNSALEFCENELLKTFYASQEAVQESSRISRNAPTSSLDVPHSSQSTTPPLDMPFASSPRRNHLHEAARNSLLTKNHTKSVSSRWQSFKEPLRLMLRIFQDLSDKNEDFWFRAVRYFQRREYQAGTVLFRRGEKANGFYLVEAGILRAEYDLPQGWLFESIVAGTTCGELPFFSETSRTATCMVERDPCVLWLMDKENWDRLQREEPDVAQELLRISLKLTSERMSVITSYILTKAG
ncbi:sulfate transporter family-domain-containing protein [Diplogelasinospora grovesii]|uniref:Sulfate transporter family-domain-containing protein n=1 Tax=Diplogelasinospora grovesii TaxID=303347 RepID=A0AAN6NDF9_9PEZI|nr:sulfate transporter family-domain-containing protein [Diplogelasinospora grovesii]